MPALAANPASARQAWSVPRDASHAATSATTAPKDIWKEALSKLSGRTSRIAAAAHATRRSVIAVRSINSASSTIPVISQERIVGTLGTAKAV